jgi:iron complex outermembrane recepter protein
VVFNSNPNLAAEKAHSLDVGAERDLGRGSLRISYFQEYLRDALYSQTDVTLTPNVTSVQNIDRIRTRGLELAYKAQDVGIRGLDLISSATFTDSMILANAKNPDSVGKQQPRIPDWRASFSATWRQSDTLSYTGSARYSGRMYNNLDNSDTNGNTYTGSSRYFVVDARVLWRFDKQWSAGFGVDNLTNTTYWSFHPFPQRTLVAELRFAL